MVTLKPYCLPVLINTNYSDKSDSIALHDETDLPGISPNQSKLLALTPVGAGSLFWLI